VQVVLVFTKKTTKAESDGAYIEEEERRGKPVLVNET